MNIEALMQKAWEGFERGGDVAASMRAAVLAVLAEVRAMVPEEMPSAHGALVSFAVMHAHNACRAEMLRRLDQMMEGK